MCYFLPQLKIHTQTHSYSLPYKNIVYSKVTENLIGKRVVTPKPQECAFSNAFLATACSSPQWPMQCSLLWAHLLFLELSSTRLNICPTLEQNTAQLVTMWNKFDMLFVGAVIYSRNTVICNVRLPICSCNLPIEGALSNGFGITSDIKTTWYRNVRHELIDIELTIQLIAALQKVENRLVHKQFN